VSTKNPSTIGAQTPIDSTDFTYSDGHRQITISATDLDTDEPVIVNIYIEATEPVTLFDQAQQLIDLGLAEIAGNEFRATEAAYNQLALLRFGPSAHERGPEPETMSWLERRGFAIDQSLRFEEAMR